MLHPLARMYLQIPASSVPVERVFSASGRIHTKTRYSLSASNVEHISFIHAHQPPIEKFEEFFAFSKQYAKERSALARLSVALDAEKSQ